MAAEEAISPHRRHPWEGLLHYRNPHLLASELWLSALSWLGSLVHMWAQLGNAGHGTASSWSTPSWVILVTCQYSLPSHPANHSLFPEEIKPQEGVSRLSSQLDDTCQVHAQHTSTAHRNHRCILLSDFPHWITAPQTPMTCFIPAPVSLKPWDVGH